MKSLRAVATGIVLALIVYLAINEQYTDTVLFMIGIGIGITLFKGMFGFASAYRKALENRDMNGVLAQIAMLAFATLLFAPILALGFVYDHEVIGAVAPLGVALAFGAFLFGIGMQLSGTCASGSLFVAAGGNVRTILVLVCFCLGAFLGSLHLSTWQALPSTEAFVLADEFGWEKALPIQLSILAVMFFVFSLIHKGAGRPLWWSKKMSFNDFIYGRWPLMLTAGLLAIFSWLILLVAGHPWSITWAFSLWGAKAATLLGWDPKDSVFWSGEFQLNALQQPLLTDDTSITNIGIFCGAFLAACIANNFKFTYQVSLKTNLTAIMSGILMGYGARLASGCNIGAFFGGISSTSMHGWLWIALAIPGCWIGIKINKMIN